VTWWQTVIVVVLERTCAVLDRVGGAGCRLGLSALSFDLDRRWGGDGPYRALILDAFPDRGPGPGREPREEGHMTDRPWLHGWPLVGDGVLIGTMVHCAGCGRPRGVTCVVFGGDWEAPDRDPDWPFDQAGCPICASYQSPRPDREAAVIVRDLVSADGVVHLREIRRRARVWADANEIMLAALPTDAVRLVDDETGGGADALDDAGLAEVRRLVSEGWDEERATRHVIGFGVGW
jgi:hypothetical protein